MEKEFIDAEKRLSKIFHYGNKVVYADEVIENIKSLYGLKKLIQKLISSKIHHLKDNLESLIQIFIDCVNAEYEIISPKKVFGLNNSFYNTLG
ncbi:MAG: hypothetical protein PHZ26_02090 [Candidatus Gracilibacteria bacterium]|nr:hypothetical protein [Candidatus Gracilibacteria bacterium]MDD2908525.1 hypothetical protein [Candidatus Gracilibacteria bacterium]